MATATASAPSMTSKPEKQQRQFQVVPVPAVFTRGRWECIDYKDPLPPVASFTIGPADQTIEYGSQSTPLPPVAQHHQQHVDTQQQQASVVVTPAAAQPSISANSSVPHFEISPSHSVPTTLGSEFVPPSACGGISSADSSMTANNSTTTSTATGCCNVTGGGAAPVAIDNKIEQAMDLVKTHLTFAVREEVDILRTTIMDLESRVNVLEHENQILRQFAPGDVVANLVGLVQAAQQQEAGEGDPRRGDIGEQQTKHSQ